MDSGITKQSKNEQIEQFLREHYSFRFNTIKCRTEMQTKENTPFRPITKFDLNSLRRELDSSMGISTSADNIRTILESDFSQRVDPIREYFNSLPPIEGCINIEKLANTVTVSNNEKWVGYLTKWLVGVIANALNDSGCQNHICLVLTGEQGKFKTTWLDNLCPKPLKSYLFTGKIDPQNKDILTLIAECLFINIDDQLKALNKRDENELKNLITTPLVKYRRPYDVYIEDYPHIASFMASVNGNDFLTDPTGSRRFLPFEVISIDIAKAKEIDMNYVYSEVMKLYRDGYRYWFNDSEINELHIQNSAFQVQTVEYEMLLQLFVKSISRDNFMTTVQIINHAKEYTALSISKKRMGEALRKAGFERISKRVNQTPIYGWLVEKINI